MWIFFVDMCITGLSIELQSCNFSVMKKIHNYVLLNIEACGISYKIY